MPVYENEEPNKKIDNLIVNILFYGMVVPILFLIFFVFYLLAIPHNIMMCRSLIEEFKEILPD